MLSSAILEFKKDGPHQQDVEIISRSDADDYIVAEVNEIVNPGEPDELRKLIDNPNQSRLLVTPDKSVLSAGGRRSIRFVALHAPDDQEYIYRVAIKPVIRGVDHDAKIGLKILVGYEVLAILRPANPKPEWNGARHGQKLTLKNTGNTNVLFQNGLQCPNANSKPENCTRLPVIRVYAKQEQTLDLPKDAPVTYSVWNGDETTEKRFD